MIKYRYCAIPFLIAGATLFAGCSEDTKAYPITLPPPGTVSPDQGIGGNGSTGGSPLASSWQGAISDKAASMFQTEYAAWKTKYYEDCGTSEGRVKRPSDGNDTVSEGIAYGMLLAVIASDQPVFDRLWNYYYARRNAQGLMNWRYAGCDATPLANNAATDAELDAAMALIMASTRFASEAYKAPAIELLNAIRQYEVEKCGELAILRPGDAWGGCAESGEKALNPSYFAPGYYKAFAYFNPEKAGTWNQLADDTYTLFTTNQNADGYVTDWSGRQGERPASGNLATYGWEACRNPWRVATDFAWTGEPRAAAFLNKMNVKAPAQHPQQVPSDTNSCFKGGYALAGINRPEVFGQYVDGWLSLSASGDGTYYQGTLRVIYLALAGGLFRPIY